LKAAVLTLWALSLFLSSCGSATAVASTDPAPQPEAVTQNQDTEPSEDEALLELVRGNIATTELSAVVEITGVRVEGPNGAPPADKGYVNHVYEVEVLTPIAGCGAVKGFTFAQMAEADIHPMAIGTVLVVSVCRDGKGSYHTPDVGYAIPRSELPASALTELKSHPNPNGASACGE
jgi:hypothetical protein